MTSAFLSLLMLITSSAAILMPDLGSGSGSGSGNTGKLKLEYTAPVFLSLYVFSEYIP